MKKISFLLLFGLFLLTSCNSGSVSGRVTYQLSEFGSPAIDQYARVFFVQKNVDTIKTVLTVLHLQKEVEKYQQYIETVKANEQFIDSLKTLIAEKETEIEQIIDCETDFEKFSNRALENLYRIKNNRNIKQESADYDGSYSRSLDVGKYTIVAISDNVKKENLLEKRGAIFIKEIDIQKGKSIKVDINFK